MCIFPIERKRWLSWDAQLIDDLVASTTFGLRSAYTLTELIFVTNLYEHISFSVSQNIQNCLTRNGTSGFTTQICVLFPAYTTPRNE